MREQEVRRIAIMTARELRGELDEIMTAEQVASYLGLAVKTVHNKANSGEIPCKKRFGRLYFSKATITKMCLE